MPNAIEGFRLAPQQRRLLLTDEESLNRRTLCAILLEGQLDKDALKKALHEVARRHSVLRTIYYRQPGLKLPIQVIAEDAEMHWREADLSDESTEEQQRLSEEFWQAERTRQVCAESRTPLCASLFSYTIDRHLLVVSLLALSADYLTMVNLANEIGALYGTGDAPEGIVDEPVQYVQISEWQNELLEGEESERGAEYWKSQDFSASKALMLPLGRPHSAPGLRHACYEVAINAETLARLEEASGKHRIDVPVFLLACWELLLYRLIGSDDIVVDTYFDGRKFEELREALGQFANWLPLRGRLDGEMKFGELLRQVEASIRDATEWQEFFNPETRDEMEASGETMPVAFEYQQWPPAQRVGGLAFSLHRQETHEGRFGAKLLCVRRDRRLRAELHYDENTYGVAAIANVADYFRTLLDAAIDDTEGKIGTLRILSVAEQRRLVEEWNETAAPYPHEHCLHELFEAQAERTPGHVAVTCGDEQLSYAELNARANQLAHYLRRAGVGSESRVGILLERKSATLVALLGVLKAGAAYIPLEPEYPVERLSFMLEDAGASMLLTQRRFSENLTVEAQRKINLDADWPRIATHEETNPERLAAPGNLAYIIYTSGSTGTPKGVMISHRGLVNYLNWGAKTYAVAEGTGVPVHSPLGFDLTVTSLFTPLIVGSRALMLPESQGITALGALLQTGRELSLVKLTPAHLELLEQLLPAESAAQRTRAFIVGGEALNGETLNFWRMHASGTRIINEYGPTETVVGCCVYEMPRESSVSGAVPIGKPIANMEMYVLDERLQPAPVGVMGELYIGGVGVALGYVNQPALSAEKFVPHPFSRSVGARLYRTGDLGRYMPDGNLEFLGRRDTQVKIRGFRIELGEVESILRQHESVREAVAVAHTDKSGERQLAAYVVEQPGASLSPGELRRYLREKLPDHMIPVAFIKLDALPLTHNGKVDRRRLPEPATWRREPEASYRPPQTELERIITQIWQEVLHIERAGVHDNFFDLGGHSFHVLKVSNKLLEAFGGEVSLMDIFHYPTISLLAKHLSREESETPATQEIQSRADTRKNFTKRQRQQRAHNRAVIK
jgi:amino acid adenylation domain-containing protein